MKTAIEVAAPRTEAWYAARGTSIGASESYDVLTNPLSVYLKKVGITPELEDNLFLKRGRLLEPLCIDEFERLSGIEVIARSMPMYRHADIQCVTATPDADLANGELLEAKTAMRWSPKCRELGAEHTDEIAEQWLLQVTQQMAVLGRDAAHVAVLLDDKVLRYRVERSEKLIAVILKANVELWQRIEAREPPEPTWDDPSTPDLVRTMYRAITGAVVPLSADGVARWMKREQLMSCIKDLTAEADELKARVIHEIGEKAGGTLGDGRYVRRKHVSKAAYNVRASEYVDVRAMKI